MCYKIYIKYKFLKEKLNIEIKILMFFSHSPVDHVVYPLNSRLILPPWRELIQIAISLSAL